jgi:diguanylate cyclase (GGDEF)-like protein
MEEALNREIRRAEQNSYSVGIIMLDVDYFKRVNDTFGHEAGDLLLKDLGKFLQKSIRTFDIACRYGGEEFTLILPEASFDILKHRAENLCQQVKSLEVEYQGQRITPITISLGVALFPDNGFTALAILRAADAALYQAKHEGRDRVVMA